MPPNHRYSFKTLGNKRCVLFLTTFRSVVRKVNKIFFFLSVSAIKIDFRNKFKRVLYLPPNLVATDP
ncbi:hypothetical protein BYT27DRAFT_6463558 [Phlegmacium glaucopus]|nr:hypothetical protein BYT27DRAFT_6463558 [Phlegmacium glaucopus]